MKRKIDDRLKQSLLAFRLISYKMMKGVFRSSFIGKGLEFNSIREYQAEDDARNIDWNVTARANKPFVKTYKEEHNINLFLCLDFSHSMYEAFNGVSLDDVAKDIAFIFSLLSFNNSIPIGSILFDGECSNIFMPSSSKVNVFKMLKNIDNKINSKKTGTAFVDAIKKTYAVLKERSFILIISDFNVVNYENYLAKLGAKHDVVCVRLESSINYELAKVGTIICKDYESDFDMIVPTLSPLFIKKRKEDYIKDIHLWKKICLKAHAYPLLINIGEDIVPPFCSFFESYNNNIRL